MRIVISPYPSSLNNGKTHPKHYPYWAEVVALIKQHYPQAHITQVGLKGEDTISGVDEVKHNLKLNTELKELVLNADVVLCVETFMFHFCKWLEKKNVIVIWGQSNPELFGYKEQCNLLKDRAYLRSSQFATFKEQIEYKKEAFVTPDIVIESLVKMMPPTYQYQN